MVGQIVIGDAASFRAAQAGVAGEATLFLNRQIYVQYGILTNRANTYFTLGEQPHDRFGLQVGSASG